MALVVGVAVLMQGVGVATNVGDRTRRSGCRDACEYYGSSKGASEELSRQVQDTSASGSCGNIPPFGEPNYGDAMDAGPSVVLDSS